MKSTSRILAIIPARGGSKGIPRKNLAELGGRPLIAWTIAAARTSLGLNRIIVSTDDADIAAIAKEYGAEAPFLRPADIAGDTASAHDVIRHALDYFNAAQEQYDAVAYLQPTSPFRRGDQISEALALFSQLSPDTLVSVVPVSHNMGPGSLMRRVGNDKALFLEPPEGQTFRRQEKEVLFARNGPAILIVSATDVLIKNKLYGERIAGYTMDHLSSLDIDEPLDLEIARCLLPLAMHT